MSRLMLPGDGSKKRGTKSPSLVNSSLNLTSSFSGGFTPTQTASLPASSSSSISRSSFISTSKSSTPPFSLPTSIKPLNSKSRSALARRELSQFTAVLSHPSFISSPLSAIREHLENTVKIQEEREKEKKDKEEEREKIKEGIRKEKDKNERNEKERWEKKKERIERQEQAKLAGKKNSKLSLIARTTMAGRLGSKEK